MGKSECRDEPRRLCAPGVRGLPGVRGMLLRDEPESKGTERLVAFAGRSSGSLPLVCEDTVADFCSKSNRTGFLAVLDGCSWLTISSMRGLCSR